VNLAVAETVGKWESRSDFHGGFTAVFSIVLVGTQFWG